jgi:hypothetical protein
MDMVLGRENRMNQEMREGLPHLVITTYTCVSVNHLGRPFRAGFACGSHPGLTKAPGLFCSPPSGKADGLLTLTPIGSCRILRAASNAKTIETDAMALNI